MGYSLRRYLPLVVAVTLAMLLAARLGITAWAWHELPAAGFDEFVRLAWIGAFVEGAVLIVACAIIGWLVRQAHSHDRQRLRLEHLAEVGLLAGGLAHEVRNYLSAMQSRIALLRKALHVGDQQAKGEGPEPQANLRQLDKLERAVVGLEELLNDFLTFARPVQDHLEEADPGQLVQEVVDFLLLDLERSGIQLQLELASQVPAVYVDRNKLKRAILNLVVNARQAMPEGGRLLLRVRGGRAAAIIEVGDTGVGIPKEEQPHIFETFFSTKAEGTGLGLAVVKRTVQDLGGEISFRSRVGAGTTFTITLPTLPRERAILKRRTHASGLTRQPNDGTRDMESAVGR